MKKKKVKSWITHHFTKYTAISLVMTIITTLILWVVDLLGGLVVYVNPLVALGFFLVKYYLYHKSGFFERHNGGLFAKYIFVWIIVVVASTLLLGLTVDYLGYTVLILNPLIMALMFGLRFLLYGQFHMINMK